MIVNPDRYIQEFANAGADILTVHYEACPHLHRTIQAIKKAGMKAGVSINPHTPVSVLEDVICDLDLVLIMSVNPGFGGQKFIETTIDKIQDAKKLIETQSHHIFLEVDGGINHETIGKVAAAGANVFVAGSAIFGSADYAETIQDFRQKIS